MSETVQINQQASEKVMEITPPLQTPVPAVTDDIALLRNDRPAELFRSYDQGIMDGLLENNTEYFSQFIDAYHFREFKNKAIYHLRGQIKELLEKQAAAKEKMDVLKREKYAKEAEREGYTTQMGYIDKVIEYWKEQIGEAKVSADYVKGIRTDYSLFPGIIFFFFACLFIAADYTICLNIVADTLKIGLEGGKKTMASHLFALAMSGLAVVLKPAYDRLIEKPYHHNEKKKRFTLTIIFLAAAVLAMLFALGMFREDIIASGLNRNATVSTSITAGGVSAPQSTAGTAHLESGWAARFGIVSSTLLFAIAGAVCLGISLPILTKNFRNYWNLAVRRKRALKEHALLKERADLEQARIKKVYEIKELEEKITALQPDLNVNDDIREKRMMIQVYQHGEMVKNIAKSTALYLAGYERGNKLMGKVPQEWLVANVNNASLGIEPTGQTIDLTTSSSSKEQGIVGKRTRPFVALRRMITHSFKKKWDKENDINIEYYNFDN